MAVRLGPKLPTGDTDLVEDADTVMVGQTRPVTFGRGDHPGIHPQQAFDHRVAAGLLSDLPDHRVERILRVLDPTARQGPIARAVRRCLPGKQNPSALDPRCTRHTLPAGNSSLAPPYRTPTSHPSRESGGRLTHEQVNAIAHRPRPPGNESDAFTPSTRNPAFPHRATRHSADNASPRSHTFGGVTATATHPCLSTPAARRAPRAYAGIDAPSRKEPAGRRKTGRRLASLLPTGLADDQDPPAEGHMVGGADVFLSLGESPSPDDDSGFSVVAADCWSSRRVSSRARATASASIAAVCCFC